MTANGPIRDISPLGYLDCSESLGNVLYELFKRKVLPRKSRRIKVLISTTIGYRDNPQRIEKEAVYSFGYLCRFYIDSEGKEFDSKEHEQKKEYRMEYLEKQGQKDRAFAPHGQYLHIQKLIEQDRIINSLPEEQRKAKEEEFEKKNGYFMRIG